jgi:C-terminal processing protease CtpA/Prc
MKKLIIGAGMLLVLLPLLAVAAGADAKDAAQSGLKQDKQHQVQQKDRVQLEQQLREAQEKLQAAAQRVAQLSMQLSGPLVDREMRMRFMRPNHAVLGITISDSDADADRNDQGVRVSAVTPNGPAENAGLRAGDVIAGINGTTFKTHGDESADDQLVRFMDGVKPGETLKVAYLRGGKAGNIQLKAGRLDADSFAFAFDVPPAPPVPPSPPAPPAPLAAPAPIAPMPPMTPRFAWFMDRDQPWGDMQLVPLTAGLGQYFGTDKGLLVVHAPKHDALKLQDGDVILNIGGREPGSPPHAIRILRSYSPGDTVKLDIMRKGKPTSLNIKLPVDKHMDMGGDISEFYQQFHFGPGFLHLGIE